jgi:hypothetical protein
VSATACAGSGSMLVWRAAGRYPGGPLIAARRATPRAALCESTGAGTHSLLIDSVGVAGSYRRKSTTKSRLRGDDSRGAADTMSGGPQSRMPQMR